jgi:MFS family permease
VADPGLLRGHADFRRLWLADALSKLGSQVMVIAMPLLAATTLGASTWEVGLLTAFATVPFLLIGLPVGAWADRVRRRPVLVAADLGRAAALAWVPVAALLGGPHGRAAVRGAAARRRGRRLLRRVRRGVPAGAGRPGAAGRGERPAGR